MKLKYKPYPHIVIINISLCSNEAIEISCCGYNMTGIYTDLTQHLLLCPLIYYHIQFHSNVTTLEQKLNYQFIDRSLLEVNDEHFLMLISLM